MENFGRISGKVDVKIIGALNLANKDLMDKSDPYCKAYLSTDPKSIIKTKEIKDNLNPVWNFEGTFPIFLLR